MDFRGLAGLKTGVENGIFWSELGSGFGEPGGTTPPRIPKSTSNPKTSSPHPPLGLLLNPQSRAWGYEYSTTFLLCNLTYYFADDVQAIWRKYLILF